MFNLFSFRRSKQAEEDRKKVQEAQAKVQKQKEGGKTMQSRLTLKQGQKFVGRQARDIYLRRYVPAAVRAEENAKEFTSGHLSNDEPYNPLSPHLHYCGRFLDPPPSLSSSRTPKPSNQTAALRISHTIAQLRIIPHDSPTLGAAYKPVFRTREKEKEIAIQDFLPYNKEYHQEAAWDTPNVYSSEPYIGGCEELGNRRREDSWGGPRKSEARKSGTERSLSVTDAGSPKGDLHPKEASAI